MPKVYSYIGPPGIKARGAAHPRGTPVESGDDVRRWAVDSGQVGPRGGRVAATFVVGAGGVLLVADRNSEHVACAGGGPVLSAGEMFFVIDAGGVRVEEVSNQSTGYCPEPRSWPAVAAALERAGISHPGGFTRGCVFRRCRACGGINIVKDEWFVCAVCDAPLDAEWNPG